MKFTTVVLLIISILLRSSYVQAQQEVKPLVPLLDSLNALEKVDSLNLQINHVTDTIESKYKKIYTVPFLDKLPYNKIIDESLEAPDKLRTKVAESIKGVNIKSDKLNQLKEIKNKISDGKSIKQQTISKIKNIEEVNEVEEKISEIKPQVEEYQGYIDDVKEGNTERLEQEAARLKPVSELQDKLSEAEQIPKEYLSEVEKFKDKDYLLEQGKDQAMEMAIDHFSGHADKLKAAQDLLKKVKKDYDEVQSIHELPEKTKHSLSETPLKERLNYGGNFQFHQGKPISIDISLTISYKITKKIASGIGGTYRYSIPTTKSKFPYIVDEGVYGFRTFGDYVFYKSFYVHLEYESLKKVSHSLDNDLKTGKWISGGLFGIGKEYNITKKVKGNVVFLYNILHNSKSPYQKPYMVRMGIIL